MHSSLGNKGETPSQKKKVAENLENRTHNPPEVEGKVLSRVALGRSGAHQPRGRGAARTWHSVGGILPTRFGSSTVTPPYTHMERHQTVGPRPHCGRGGYNQQARGERCYGLMEGRDISMSPQHRWLLCIDSVYTMCQRACTTRFLALLAENTQKQPSSDRHTQLPDLGLEDHSPRKELGLQEMADSRTGGGDRKDAAWGSL